MSTPNLKEVAPGWGNRIAAARIKRGWTQTELGTALGVVKITVGRWEKEKHPVPEATWPTMASLLQVNIHWLTLNQGGMEETGGRLWAVTTGGDIPQELKRDREISISANQISIWALKFNLKEISKRLEEVHLNPSVAGNPLEIIDEVAQSNINPHWITWGNGEKYDNSGEGVDLFLFKLHCMDIIRVSPNRNDGEHESYSDIQQDSPGRMLLRSTFGSLESIQLSDNEAIQIHLAIQEALNRIKAVR